MSIAQETINKALERIRQDPQFKAMISDQKFNRVQLLMNKIESGINNPMNETNIEVISGDLCDIIDLLKNNKK
jgi:hypothetical protein